jgi:hypothetical protein
MIVSLMKRHLFGPKPPLLADRVTPYMPPDDVMFERECREQALQWAVDLAARSMDNVKPTQIVTAASYFNAFLTAGKLPEDK